MPALPARSPSPPQFGSFQLWQLEHSPGGSRLAQVVSHVHLLVRRAPDDQRPRGGPLEPGSGRTKRDCENGRTNERRRRRSVYGISLPPSPSPLTNNTAHRLTIPQAARAKARKTAPSCLSDCCWPLDRAGQPWSRLKRIFSG